MLTRSIPNADPLRYTQHSAYSIYSNSNSPSSTNSVDDREETKTTETKAAPTSTSVGGGGGGRSGSDGGGRGRGVQEVTQPLPRTKKATNKTDGEGGQSLEADDGARGRVAASAAQGTRKQGRASTDRRTRVTATASTTDGFASDMGGSRKSAGSGRRPIYRTMSLRGRSFFSGGGGNAGTGERRAVSMSAFRSRGESLREDGEYHRSYSWRGGGRGVANRVCSVLSARWLFSRSTNKKDSTKEKKKYRRRGGDTSNASRRSTYTSGGVVGVVDGGEFSSSEDDSDDDDDVVDVVDVTSSMNIPIAGAPGRAGKTRVLRGGGGGPRDEDTGRLAAGDGGSATAGGGSVGPVTTATSGRKRIGFPRSTFLGFNRSAQRLEKLDQSENPGISGNVPGIGAKGFREVCVSFTIGRQRCLLRCFHSFMICEPLPRSETSSCRPNVPPAAPTRHDRNATVSSSIFLYSDP